MKTKPSLGIRDPYELTKPQFNAAVALLKQQKPLVKRYWNYAADQIQDFKNGDVSLGATWPYQTLYLQAAKVPVKDEIPKEGATGWADTWMLAAKAPHPNCAYLWMRYVTTPKVQARQAFVFGETPVNPLACPYMNKIQAGLCTEYHLNAPASYLRSIHFWKTPIADLRLRREEGLRGLHGLAAGLDADHRIALVGDRRCTGGGPLAGGSSSRLGGVLAASLAEGIGADRPAGRPVRRHLPRLARRPARRGLLDRGRVHE